MALDFSEEDLNNAIEGKKGHSSSNDDVSTPSASASSLPQPVPASSVSAPAPARKSPAKVPALPSSTPAPPQSTSTNPLIFNLTNSFLRLQTYLDHQLGALFPWSLLPKNSAVHASHVFLGLLVLGFFLVSVGILQTFICSAVGFGYPALASLQALKTPTKTDDTHWLIYWVVFAWLNILEYFRSILLWCFPSWYVLKYLFLVWATLPFTGGARIVFEQVVTRAMWLHSFVFTKLD